MPPWEHTMSANSFTAVAMGLILCLFSWTAEARTRHSPHRTHARHHAPRVYNDSNYTPSVNSGRGTKSKSFVPRKH
jgi:hypothetical protein